MAKNYLKAFNVEDSEQGIVILLLCQSVFLGIFSGAFDIGASTLFLDAYPDMLPKAILVSGLAGILITSLYSRLQATISFSKLAIINLAFIFTAAFLLWLGYQFTSAKWLAFLAFVLFGPLNIISIVGFWGMATRLFTLRQGKRLFGLVDTGQVVGIIITTFAIPVMLAFGLRIKDLLLICSISAVGALIMQSVIVKRYRLESSADKSENKTQQTGIKFLDLFRNKYTRYIVFFVALSMVSAFFVFNSFLSVAKAKYPDMGDFAKFLGVFTGTVMIFSVLVKTFVYSNLLKTYGLRIGLLLSPLLIFLLTFGASLIGTFGYTPESRIFIFFFLMVTLSRLLSVSLKVSIESPSSKLLYQSLDEGVRHDVQAKVDGVINETSALLSGVILAVLGSFAFLKLIHLSYILFVIVGLWIFVAWKLHAAYRKSLEENLQKSQSGKSETESQTAEQLLISRATESAMNDEEKVKALLLLRALSPQEFENLFPQLLQKGSVPIREFAMHYIEEQKMLDSLPLMNKVATGRDLRNIEAEVKTLSEQHTFGTYLKAREKHKRILAARYLGSYGDQASSANPLGSLLRDADNEVKAAAFMSAIKLKLTDLAPVFADYLDHPVMGNHAYDALRIQGSAVIDVLEQYYYKTGTTVHTQLKIIRLMGEIGGKEATDYLISKLNSPNIDLLNQTVMSLLQCGYKFSEKHRIEFNNAINLVLSVIAWLLSVQSSARGAELPDTFLQAIKDEQDHSYDLLYHLLSLLYDANSVGHVRKNIETGTGESIGYALELMDIFVDEELKPTLIPFFEDTSLDEKVKSLQHFFPVEAMTTRELLISVMNRDYNHIGLWTKACAIWAFRNIDTEITDDMVALLFHPERIIHQSAAIAINEKNNTKIQSLIDRISPGNRKSIREALEASAGNKHRLIFEKVLFMKQVELFSACTGETILALAREATVLTDTAAWNELPEGDKDGLFLVAEGAIEITNKTGEKEHIGQLELYETVLADIKIDIKDNGIIYFIPRTAYNRFLFDNSDFVKVVLSNKREN